MCIHLLIHSYTDTYYPKEKFFYVKTYVMFTKRGRDESEFQKNDANISYGIWNTDPDQTNSFNRPKLFLETQI